MVLLFAIESEILFNMELQDLDRQLLGFARSRETSASKKATQVYRLTTRWLAIRTKLKPSLRYFSSCAAIKKRKSPDAATSIVSVQHLSH